MHHQKQKAFTLVELLVVLAIVMVLLSLVTPQITRARKTAHQAKCASNQRQIGIAFAQYATDFSDYVPAILGSGSQKSWYSTLGQMGYLGTPRLRAGVISGLFMNRYAVFECPAEIPSNAYHPTLAPYTSWDNDWIGTSYAINWSVAGNLLGTTNPPRKGFSAPRPFTPSDARLMVDAHTYAVGFTSVHFDWNIDGDPGYAAWGATAFRHLFANEKANFLYFDGHVAPRSHYYPAVTGVNPALANFQFLWGTTP